jgi:hypothetical protein
MVVLTSFYECGFGFPLHPLVQGIMFYYGLELQSPFLEENGSDTN